MTDELATSSVYDDDNMVLLAREIAMDIHPLEDILKRHNVGPADWDVLCRHPRFAGYLNDALVTWQSAMNAADRIKVKSLAAIEDWLLTAHELLHVKDGSLRDKVELAKLVARLAGVGEAKTDMPVGEKISITINMGDERVVAHKIAAAPVTIEHEDKL